MAKLKDKNDLSVSLFPMFNILISTLGVLILIMGTISTISLNKNKIIRISDESFIVNGKKTAHHFVWDGKRLISLDQKDTLLLNTSGLKKQELKNGQYFKSSLDKSKIGSLIQQIKEKNKTEYIVVFVKESGFDNFIFFRDFIKSEGIDIGYEPLKQ